MKRAILVLVIALIFSVVITAPDGFAILLVLGCFTLPFATLIINLSEVDPKEKELLWSLFLYALAVRAVFGAVTYSLGFWDYLASDARTYTEFGSILADHFRGTITITKTGSPFFYSRFFEFSGSGWGMYYIVASLYFFIGHNTVAGNFFVASIATGAVPVVYSLAKEIYKNRRVALIASLLVGFMPGFINWSSFIMKDGIIIFLLALSILMVVRLQKQFSLLYLSLLFISVIGIISLRFYIFPMLAIGIITSFLIGVKEDDTTISVFRRVVVLLILGTALTYAGVLGRVTRDLEKYGTLEMLNNSRSDQARSAASGFETVEDVSTVEGVVTVLPLGFLYLMLAPLPWQVTSIRSALTQPEMVLWWFMIPFVIKGIAYSIRNRLRETLAILVFTLMLTVGYSIFQGNIGTAYRQRTQMQVFYFVFFAVGWVLTKEKKENEMAIKRLRQIKLQASLAEKKI